MSPNKASNGTFVHWTNCAFLIGTFVLAMLAVPAFLWHYGQEINLWIQAAIFGCVFMASGLSITLGYHRLFSHLSFSAKWPVKLATLLFGAAAMENSALVWCSDHRRHHKHVDHDDDPYNIKKGFWHAHIGWILFKSRLEPPMDNVADLRRDGLVMWQHRWYVPLGLLVGFGLPTLLGWVADGPLGALGGLLIGGVARQVAVHHMTFCINSLCHTLGTQPYSSQCTAKDSWIMALFTFGEGYHNFHHEFQHDYRNAVKSWQWDPTKWTIWTLSKLGLVSKLRRVPREAVMLAEVQEKSRCLEAQLLRQVSPVCEKASAFFAEAQAKLAEASEAWEKARREHARAMHQKITSTREQVAELKAQLEQTITELREAIKHWHEAHSGLANQLA